MAFDPVSLLIYVALTTVSLLLNRQNVESGKLDDISADTGSYNRIIPFVLGSQLIVPQTIWIANDQLIEVKDKQGIGPFSIGGSITTYTYFATFAAAMTGNQVQVRKIWAGDKLIYDGGSQLSSGFDPEYVNSDFYHEFKDGSQDQSISQIMSSVDGEDQTPAYRGTSYIVFENLALKDFGNSIPQFKCEVIEVNTVNHTAVLLPAPIGNFASTASVDQFGRMIQIGTSNFFTITDPINQTVEAVVQGEEGSDIFFGPGTGYDPQLNGVLRGSSGGDAARIFDATTGETIGAANGDTFQVESAVYQKRYFWMADISNNVRGVDVGSMINLNGIDEESFDVPGTTNFMEVAPTGRLPRFGVSYTDSSGFGSTLFIEDGAQHDLDILGYGTRPGIGYSETENAFLVFGSGGITKIDLTGNVIASNPIVVLNNKMAGRNLSEHNHKRIWLARADSFISFNVCTMLVEREIFGSDISGMGTPDQVMTLPNTNAFLSFNSGAWHVVYVDRVDQEDTTVQHVVEFLANKIDFPPSRLDASAGTRTISGMIIGSEESRQAIDELLKVKGYDIIEEDGKIKLKDRGGAPVLAVDYDDLGTDQKNEDGEGTIEYRLERGLLREADSPWKHELSFVDIDGDYEVNLVIAKRPRDAVQTRKVTSVDTPIALDVDTAKTDAAKMLSQYWRERASIRITLPAVKYAHLSPTDVITVPDGDDLLNVKIIRVSGAKVTEIEGIIDDPTGIDTLLTGAPRNTPPVTINPSGRSSVIMIDSALPNDFSDSQDGYGMSSQAIPSTLLIGSIDILRTVDDGENVEGIAVTSGEPLIGITDVAFENIAYPNLKDNKSQITMTLSSAPVSATEEQLINDQTLNLIFVKAGSDWELIQFENVTDNGNNSYTLNGFYRGLRGTEHLVGQHSNADLVIFYNDGYVRGGEITHYQQQASYSGIRNDEDQSPIIMFTPEMIGLRPYSPTNLKIEKPVDDNIITWNRRTRIGGSQLDETDVPLSETSEEYEIDILDAGLAVVATKTGITSESYTYTEADQITDLGAEHTEYTARVFQISAEVGRGVGSDIYTENLNPIKLLTVSKVTASLLAMNDGDLKVSKVTVWILGE